MSSNSNGDSGETSNQTPIVFLHAGTYRGEFLVIDCDVSILGKFC